MVTEAMEFLTNAWSDTNGSKPMSILLPSVTWRLDLLVATSVDPDVRSSLMAVSSHSFMGRRAKYALNLTAADLSFPAGSTFLFEFPAPKLSHESLVVSGGRTPITPSDSLPRPTCRCFFFRKPSPLTSSNPYQLTRSSTRVPFTRAASYLPGTRQVADTPRHRTPSARFMPATPTAAAGERPYGRWFLVSTPVLDGKEWPSRR